MGMVAMNTDRQPKSLVRAVRATSLFVRPLALKLFMVFEVRRPVGAGDIASTLAGTI